ncbi:uncharacterized protein [Symphalangus syndactylus]|uniref:uncharacterized protein n=1 Tax=Symphalangus syndactylus TaxID=9590 RepID=UPI003006B7CF
MDLEMGLQKISRRKQSHFSLALAIVSVSDCYLFKEFPSPPASFSLKSLSGDDPNSLVSEGLRSWPLGRLPESILTQYLLGWPYSVWLVVVTVSVFRSSGRRSICTVLDFFGPSRNKKSQNAAFHGTKIAQKLTVDSTFEGALQNHCLYLHLAGFLEEEMISLVRLRRPFPFCYRETAWSETSRIIKAAKYGQPILTLSQDICRDTEVNWLSPRNNKEKPSLLLCYHLRGITNIPELIL